MAVYCRGSSPYIDIVSIYIYHLGHTVRQESKQRGPEGFRTFQNFQLLSFGEIPFSYNGCLNLLFI